MGKKKKDTTIPYDEELLREIAPIGNLKHYDAYSRTGTGFEACVHIFDFPNITKSPGCKFALLTATPLLY